LWCDESQLFVTSHDAIFQSTARSARAATVYLTRFAGYLATIGAGATASPLSRAYGQSGTKIFHATPVRRQIFGRRNDCTPLAIPGNSGTSTSEDDRSGSRVSRSVGATDALNFRSKPHEFTLLRKGGPENDLCVDAFVFQAGRIWNSTHKKTMSKSLSDNLKALVTQWPPVPKCSASHLWRALHRRDALRPFCSRGGDALLAKSCRLKYRRRSLPLFAAAFFCRMLCIWRLSGNGGGRAFTSQVIQAAFLEHWSELRLPVGVIHGNSGATSLLRRVVYCVAMDRVLSFGCGSLHWRS